MPTTFGPHHIGGEAGFRDYSASMQLPIPNPLMPGAGQGAPFVTQGPPSEQDVFGDDSSELPHRLQPWPAQHTGWLEPPQPSPQAPAPAWEAREVEGMDSDASMADSDEELDHLDALAIARAQKQREQQWHGSNTFMGSSAAYGRTNILTHYLRSPHHTIFQSAEMRQVYQQFISITGPTISLYERPPYRNPEENGQHSLWSCRSATLRFSVRDTDYDQTHYLRMH